MMVVMESERSTTKSMEINIPIEELQKRSLFIATPMYGGQCAGMYTKSVNDLASLCMHYKINEKFYYLFNDREEGPISARNLALIALSKNISLSDLQIRSEDDSPGDSFAAEFEPLVRDEYNRRKPG